MKKSTIAIIATGLISLALCVIFSVITVIVFTKTAASKINTEELKNLPQKIEEIVGEDGFKINFVDENGINQIDLSEGLDIDSNGDQVHIGTDGIQVHDSNGEDVSISLNGITVGSEG